jgi:hypothetical protein
MRARDGNQGRVLDTDEGVESNKGEVTETRRRPDGDAPAHKEADAPCLTADIVVDAERVDWDRVRRGLFDGRCGWSNARGVVRFGFSARWCSTRFSSQVA